MNSANEKRQERILDAAAELIAHYGYDKTTVDDIARAAGVSKGTIYLHFRSKSELLGALLARELELYAEQWLALIDQDPDGGTIAGMYKNSLYALSDSAFMSAIFRRDRRVFGSYLREPGNIFRDQPQGQDTRYQFVKMMQDAGAIRQDIDAKVTAHIMNILAYGLVGMDEIMADENIPPVDDVIEGIADFMHRALTPAEGGNREAGKAILRKIADSARAQIDEQRSAEG